MGLQDTPENPRRDSFYLKDTTCGDADDCSKRCIAYFVRILLVDGSERAPFPTTVWMVVFYLVKLGQSHQPQLVVWDFFHQQYGCVLLVRGHQNPSVVFPMKY